MTTRQEEFEAWYSNYGEQPRSVEKSPNGTYKFISAAVAWSTWQAATLRQEAKIKVLRESLAWALSNISEEPYEWSCEEDSDAHTAAIALAKETP